MDYFLEESLLKKLSETTYYKNSILYVDKLVICWKKMYRVLDIKKSTINLLLKRTRIL